MNGGDTVWSHDDVKELFCLSNASEDYCVDEQDDKVVFGGWNRVYLYPDGSIKVSERHCNQRFLQVAEELGIEFV